MGEQVNLIPLFCPKCDTAIPAELDESAWVCRQCGQGLFLDEEKGLLPVQVFYQTGIPAGVPDGKAGWPYWVADGSVQVGRQVYGGKNENQVASAFWAQPRQFFIPAYTCALETLVSLGPRLLLNPPDLQPGPPVSFMPVTLLRRDLTAMAEVIILAIEADRKDKLKQIRLTINLSEPTLWILKE